MDCKRFVLSGVASGILILVIMTLFGFITQIIAPYDITSIGGMRALDDPIMALFFLAPFVIGFVTTYVYELTKKAFNGDKKSKALKLTLIMYLVYVVPSEFIILTSMTYPIGFHLDNLVGGLIYLTFASFVIVKIMK